MPLTASVIRPHGLEIGPYGGADFQIMADHVVIGAVTLHFDKYGALYTAGDSVDYWCDSALQKWVESHSVSWDSMTRDILDAANEAWEGWMVGSRFP